MLFVCCVVYFGYILLKTKLMRFIYLLRLLLLFFFLLRMFRNMQTYNYYIINFSIKDIKLLYRNGCTSTHECWVCVNIWHIEINSLSPTPVYSLTLTWDGNRVDSMMCGIFANLWNERKFRRENCMCVFIKNIWRLIIIKQCCWYHCQLSNSFSTQYNFQFYGFMVCVCICITWWWADLLTCVCVCLYFY